MARLTKEQRDELTRQLAEDDEAAAQDEDEYEYEIGRGDNYARVSSKSKAGRKLAAFFRDSFGIDLDDEPVQEPEADPEAKPKGGKPAGRGQQQGGEVRAFSRRIG